MRRRIVKVQDSSSPWRLKGRGISALSTPAGAPPRSFRGMNASAVEAFTLLNTVLPGGFSAKASPVARILTLMPDFTR